MKAQTSLEFMVMAAPIVLIFLVTVFIYSDYAREASQMKKMMEASSICLQAASAIGSLASLPGNSSLVLNLPRQLDGESYSAYVSASARTVKVNYGNAGIACRLPLLDITNSTGAAFFMLERNATIKGTPGGIVVEP
ncbi:MAG: hypothetical protein QW568_02110 [Candidatus Anstonellaceae archaeon]